MCSLSNNVASGYDKLWLPLSVNNLSVSSYGHCKYILRVADAYRGISVVASGGKVPKLDLVYYRGLRVPQLGYLRPKATTFRCKQRPQHS